MEVIVKYQAVFERCEKKFLLTIPQYKAVKKLLNKYMLEDAYGLSTISSLYLDTDTYEIIRKSIEKPKYKEKLRIRTYGKPHSQDTVYFELKKKLHGIVYKRRMGLSLQESERYLKAGIRPKESGQIFRK